MYVDGKILIAKSDENEIYINPKMANRHGLIAGATGTGKTVTLKVMAESFSDMGVPVFLADAKGDLAGTIMPGEENENVSSRVSSMGLAEKGYSFKSYPVTFWDVLSQGGIPLRTTVSEMGPTLLSRIMELNDTQTDIMNIIFKIADDEGLLLIDTKDLRSMLRYVSENAAEYSLKYGNLAKQSIAAITRALVSLETEGGESFFGEPALSIGDLMKVSPDGRGMIHILDSRQLMMSPKLYATFMLWLISELFEGLPEEGDLAKPKMVFFFDEAHMLFDDAPKSLVSKVEQMVKLIRSKGVGIYFVTQNPTDIPDGVLAQLGNKVQHALRAYTPAEQKNLKAAAQGFRENPAFKTLDELSNLGTGEALISVLDEQGIPTIVEKCKVLPPQSYMGAISDAQRSEFITSSLYSVKYNEMFDRDSAYEFLERRDIQLSEEAERAAQEALEAKEREKAEKEAEKERERAEKEAERERQKYIREQERAQEKAEREAQRAAEKAEKERQREAEKKSRETNNAINSVGRSVSGTVGREIGNTLGKTVGGSFGKRLGGNLGSSLGRGLFNTFLKK